MTKRRRPQPFVIRATHWINVPVLVLMGMSGLQILNAYPMFGPRGAAWDWVPLAHAWTPFPSWLTAGHWLAGARHLHFALAWLLVANAIVYLLYIVISGEIRQRWFWPPRDTLPAIRQQLVYLAAVPRAILRRRRRTARPPAELYNALQRAAYTGAFALGVVEVLSGLAIYKPVQLHWLAWTMGGYDGARAVHFLSLLALAAFAIAHVAMVGVHWRTLPDMVTGGRRHA